MGSLKTDDDKIQNNISEERSKVKKYIDNLKDDKTKFNSYMNGGSDSYNSINGQEEVSHLVLKSNYIHYIIWILLFFTLCIIALHAVVTDSYDGISVMISLVLMYIVVRFVYNRV